MMKKILSDGRYTLGDKGYLLLEVILSFFILSLIFILLGRFIRVENKLSKRIQDGDNVLKNINFGLMYMETEISHSDMIYKIKDIEGYRNKYEDIGILVAKDKKSSKERTYSYYYFNEGSLLRRTITWGQNGLPSYSDLMNNRISGVNSILTGADRVELDFIEDGKMIDLKLYVDRAKSIEEFHRTIYIYNLEDGKR